MSQVHRFSYLNEPSKKPRPQSAFNPNDLTKWTANYQYRTSYENFTGDVNFIFMIKLLDPTSAKKSCNAGLFRPRTGFQSRKQIQKLF